MVIWVFAGGSEGEAFSSKESERNQAIRSSKHVLEKVANNQKPFPNP